MAVECTTAPSSVPQYHSLSKIRYIQHYHHAADMCSNIEIPLSIIIPTCKKRNSMNKSSTTSPRYMHQEPKKAIKVFTQLSPQSQKKLSSCANKENMRALLGYIRKRRQSENSNELPTRRRRSFPKQLKRASKRSKKQEK
jgi:hypothetical protein